MRVTCFVEPSLSNSCSSRTSIECWRRRLSVVREFTMQLVLHERMTKFSSAILGAFWQKLPKPHEGDVKYSRGFPQSLL